MTTPPLRLAQVDAVLTVTLADPPANALGPALLGAVEQVFDALETADVRVVIVTGDGAIFSLGADADAIRGPVHALVRRCHRLLDRIEQSPKPFIAAINGHCLGGGLELALACHLRVAGSRAKLGLPEVGLGLVPGAGATYRLPSLVGRARAHELILTGRSIKAEEAWRMGLVNAVVAPDDVLPAAVRLARRIAARPPAAVRAAMQCLNGGLEPASAIAQLLERRCFEGLIESAEVRRALAALPAGSGERREGCPT